MNRGRILWFAFSAIIAAAVGYFVTNQTSSHSTSRFVMTASALPPITARQFDVAGGFPTIADAPFDDTAVNRSLRSVLVAAEASYSSQVRGMLQVPKGERPTNVPGIYATLIDPNLISVSSQLVSGLVPVASDAYGGVGVQDWISYSIAMPSGRQVDLVHTMFRNPTLALAYIALETAKQFCTTGVGGACYYQTPLEAERDLGLSPVPVNQESAASNDQYVPLPPSGPSVYRYMALTPSGLAIGFPSETAVAGGSRTGIVIPYRLLQPYLSAYGKKITSSAVEPDLSGLSKDVVTKQWMALWGDH